MILDMGFVHVVREAGLAMTASHDEMRRHLSGALRTALGVTNESPYGDWPYIVDVFNENIVYSHKGGMFRRKYTTSTPTEGADPVITFSGEPKPVHRAYVDTKGTKEAQSTLFLEGRPTETPASDPASADIQVREGVVLLEHPMIVKESAKSIPIKIIGPGWGTMAYYSKEVLQRDGPKVFTKGTHMMWNHATETQESERPEGDLNDLAAVLTKDAEWRDNGAKGPGLYAEAKVFSDYAEQVTEKGPHIGISINAAIRGKEGTAEGRTGRIAEQFVRAFSADFVTKAGAGGAPVVPVRESGRGPQEQETRTMTDQEQKELNDLRTAKEASDKKLAELEAKAKESQDAADRAMAVETVTAVLKEAGIPASPKVIARACATPVMKEGKPDADWVKSVVADFADGHEGVIEGFGETQTTGTTPKADADATAKRLKESLKRLGVPENGLDYAVTGR